mmetsp:Transcript_30498/g.46193  ORF Transcript_30498/g.46193 Transcript_30498/m.46193 type:complete len:322 (+) Transcript_30498:93-1058(+)
MQTISEGLMQINDSSRLHGVSNGEGSQQMSVCSDSKASMSAYSRTDFMNAPVQQTNQGNGFFRRMPCKARGVPGEHVARNAYIDIPLHAKHGCLLSCSHPACRMSGRLFRFCAVCQVPVAKRNFARRHTHGLSLSEIISSTASDLDASATRPGTLKSTAQNMDSERLSNLESNNLPQKVVSSNNYSRPFEKKIPGEISVGSEMEKRNGGMTTSGNIMLMEENPNSQFSQRTSISVTEDELDWLYLFRQRPGPNDSKSAWLKRVEQVSGVPVPASPTSAKKAPTRSLYNNVEDEVLSDIEPTEDGADGLVNFDTSNMEELFE